MSQKVKEEVVGYSPSSSPMSVGHLTGSGSPIVITRATGGTPVSAVRIDSSGRATPVSLIKTDGRGKAPPLVKIVRPSPVVKVESVKSEPVMRKFDPSAVAVAVPRKVVPRTAASVRPVVPKPEPSSSSTDSNDVVHEFIVRAPKLGRRRFSVLRFTGGVDFTKCDKAVMQRENNLREFKSSHDIVDAPKTGAGSEYRREQREEARRKKYGLKTLEYNPHDQPWMLQFQPTAVKTEVKDEPRSKLDTKVKDESKAKPDSKVKDEAKVKPDTKGRAEMKRFRGHREGSITDNVTYFVFTQCKDGAFEAFPISSWYKMTAAPPYKHLNTDEAELEFARRGKIRNYMNLMVARRLQEANEEGEEEGRAAGEEKGTETTKTPVVAKEALSAVTKAAVTKVDAERNATKNRKAGKGKKAGKKKRSLLLTEMDEWLDEDEEDDDDDEMETKDTRGEEEGESDSETRNRDSKKKRVRRGAGRKQQSDSEVEDDSEPDDREGEEVDYMTHSSSDEEKLDVDQREAIYEEKGVAEEDALKGLLTDASSEDENPEEEDDEEDTKDGSGKRKDGSGDRSERGSGRGNAGKNSDDSSSSSSSSDESDSDLEKEAAKVRPILSKLTPLSSPVETPKPAQQKPSSSGASSTSPSSSPSSSVWAAAVRDDEVRKRKAEADDGADAKRMRSDGAVTEEAIRRYLLRKPMSAKDLLLKFSRRSSLRTGDISKQIANHLQRMRVQKRNVNGQTLLSLTN